MRALRVKDVELILNHVFVASPKNRRSRYVPLEGALPGVFKGLIAGKGPEDFVLPHWGYTYLKDHFYAICAAVGIENLHIHDWRHTFAYGKLSQGESIYKVSLLMGHSSVNVTQQHYGHLAIGDLRSKCEILPFLPCNRIATDGQNGYKLNDNNDATNQ
jgi:integrase